MRRIISLSALCLALSGGVAAAQHGGGGHGGGGFHGGGFHGGHAFHGGGFHGGHAFHGGHGFHNGFRSGFFFGVPFYPYYSRGYGYGGYYPYSTWVPGQWYWDGVQWVWEPGHYVR